MAQGAASLLLEIVVTRTLPLDNDAWVACIAEAIEGVGVEGCVDDAVERLTAAIDHAQNGRLRAQLCSPAVGSGASELACGATCLAVLQADGEWHEAVVEAARGADVYDVRFVQFGHVQATARADIVLEEDIADDEEDGGVGVCELCARDQQRLTRHHLMPRSEHARLAARVPRATLLLTCSICRACHNTVHRTASNAGLAADLYTVELLRAHPDIVRWVDFAQGTTRTTSWDTAVLRNQRRK